MKQPCKECPFRKDSLKGWLADYTVEELHNIVMSEQIFPCHMTLPDHDITFKQAGNYPICAGSLMYMKKGCKSPRNKKLNDQIKEINIKDCEIVLSVPEFFKHHKI